MELNITLVAVVFCHKSQHLHSHWASVLPCPASVKILFVFLADRMDGKVKEQKRHQQKHSGPKAEKKKLRKQGGTTEEDGRRRNPKAFAVQSAVRMAKTFHRSVLRAFSVCQIC